jgi:hypothetical protein
VLLFKLVEAALYMQISFEQEQATFAGSEIVK